MNEAIEENPAAVRDYRSGKKTAAQFIVGRAMKKSKGKANPELLLAIVRQILDSS